MKEPKKVEAVLGKIHKQLDFNMKFRDKSTVIDENSTVIHEESTVIHEKLNVNFLTFMPEIIINPLPASSDFCCLLITLAKLFGPI